jgi:Holliday junction resolvase RusA-like endonuclease
MTPTRKPVEAVMLDLPRPISTNSLWRTTKGGGWYLSPPYKAWKQEVGLIINANRVGCVFGPYAITVRVKADWRADLDNCLKSLSDALQEFGVIENDRLAQKIVIERCPSTEGMSVLVCSTEKRG